MITSAPLDSSGTPSTLIKPRNWPACFKESAALKVFLNKTIKGKKVRLTAQPPPDIAEALKDVVAATGSNADMVMEISRALGWEVVRGVAIFEVEQQPGVFVAQERAWNLHPRNIWVRLGDAEHEELVLVEADTARLASKMRPSTQGGSQEQLAPPKPSPPPARQAEREPPVSVDDPMPTPATQQPSAAAELQPVATAAAATTAATAPANDEDDDPLPTSFDDALKLISVGPKAAANGGRFPKQRPKGKYAEEDPESEFVARPGRRPVWVGEPPNETKKVVDWPGKCTKVRLRVNLETKTFDLEARCWGAAAWQGDDKDKDLMAEIYGGEVEWFAPPEYGDEKAAVLSVSGRLHITDDSKGAGNDFVRMLVDTVDEQRNGKRRPPITSDDIYSACGKSLLNPIECSWRKFGQNLSLKLDRRSDWSVGFDRDQSR
jgi:hypothetical protein